MGAFSKHFASIELACHHCGRNECTQALVDALEQFRAAAGLSVHVNDAYRCEFHNKAVGGVDKSQHELGTAADISVVGLSGADLEKIARQCPLIKGIGRDDRNDYLHIDVRDSDRVVQWCYGADGKQCLYFTPQGA